MDKTYHYYCIRVLSEMAGFPVKDAQTIAYASQYADDASEHKALKIANVPNSIDYPRYYGTTFDPICTAHSAKTWHRKLWKWARFYLKPKVQRQILMVFHFIPPMAIQGHDAQDGFDFVTQKNSRLANELLDNALDSLKNATLNTDEYELSLVKTGLALHTYSDTWAHCGFSGRHSSVENDIKNIKMKNGNRFSSVNIWENIISYAAPDIGHSEASTIPDTMSIHWKASYSDRRKRPRAINRDNAQEFMDASKIIHEKLTAVAPNPSQTWDTFANKLKMTLGKNETWQNSFPGVSSSYSRFDWREEALCGDTVDWDDFDDESDFARLNLKWTGNDLKWFWFHKAAYEQRMFLAEKIPNSWSNT